MAIWTRVKIVMVNCWRHGSLVMVVREHPPVTQTAALICHRATTMCVKQVKIATVVHRIVSGELPAEQYVATVSVKQTMVRIV